MTGQTAELEQELERSRGDAEDAQSESKNTTAGLNQELDELRQKLTEEQQAIVRAQMQEDVIRPLQAYRIDPSHVKLEKRIGEGAFGEVWVSSFRGTKVAVKRMKSHAVTKEEAKKFREEALLSEFVDARCSLPQPRFVGNRVQPPQCCLFLRSAIFAINSRAQWRGCSRKTGCLTRTWCKCYTAAGRAR